MNILSGCKCSFILFQGPTNLVIVFFKTQPRARSTKFTFLKFLVFVSSTCSKVNCNNECGSLQWPLGDYEFRKNRGCRVIWEWGKSSLELLLICKNSHSKQLSFGIHQIATFLVTLIMRTKGANSRVRTSSTGNWRTGYGLRLEFKPPNLVLNK